MMHNPVDEAAVILLGTELNKGAIEKVWRCL